MPHKPRSTKRSQPGPETAHTRLHQKSRAASPPECATRKQFASSPSLHHQSLHQPRLHERSFLHRRLSGTTQNSPPLPPRFHQHQCHHHYQHSSDRRIQPVVEDQPPRRASRRTGSQRPRLRQKPHSRIRIEHLLPRRRKRHCHQPRQRRQRHGRIPRPVHLDDDRSGHAQRHRRQQLIRNTKQRPQRINPAQRILHSLPQKISPRRDDQRAGPENRRIPTRPPQRLVHMPQRILHHEPRYPRTRIKNGQDKQRFKHDGEVIPKRHQRLPAQAVRKNVRHAHRKRGRSARPVIKRLLAHRVRQRLHIGRSHRKTPTRNSRCSRSWRLPHHPRRTINRKIDPRLHHAGRDDRHNRDR